MTRKQIQIGIGILTVLLIGFVYKKLTVKNMPELQVKGMSLYKVNLPSNKVPQTFVAEIDFLLTALKIVHANGWSGKREDPLPISITDFEPQQVEQYIAREQERKTGIDIPESLLPLYTTLEAREELWGLVIKTRSEFLEYARFKGVDERYVSEIETETLPAEADRIIYIANEKYPDTRTTNVHSFNGDNHRELVLEVYASNIYKVAREIEQAGIIGHESRLLRDVALRYVVFHEMTHVLQHASHIVNAPANAKTSLLPWLYSGRSILDISSGVLQTWGTTTDQVTRDINNMEIAKESQAEGVAVLIVGDVYNFSKEQQLLWWSHHFGSLDQARETIDELMQLSAEWYPELHVGTLAHRLGTETADLIQESEKRATFLKMHERLDGLLAVHYGYLHPLLPEEVDRFWDYFRK